MVAFDYKYLPISDLQVKTIEDPKTGKPKVTDVLVHDEPIEPTDRFWVSLFARYGFGSSFFRYFTHAEVFDRISQRESQDRMRLCVERDTEKGKSRLLGVSNPTKPVVIYDDLMELLDRYEGTGISYANGLVESTHQPRVVNNFNVGGDTFGHRFVMSTAVDGYGQPNVFLSLLRMVCSNGMIAYSPAFRQTLALGKGSEDVTPALTRVLDGFNNDEGFATVRQRMEAATQSWCSVYEAQSLYTLLSKMHNTHQLNVDDPTLKLAPNAHRYLEDGEAQFGTPVIRAYHNMTGDTSKLYGLANLDSLSPKRQRTLPVRCTVYDAINLATEVATHYAAPAGARQLNAWVGTLISGEYDMENTKDKFGDFADFHVTAKLAAPELTGVN